MVTLQSYHDQHLALQDLAMLQENNIEASLAQRHEHGVQIYELEIEEDDFQNAQNLLSIDQGSAADGNHMQDFTDDELKEILINEVHYSSIMIETAKTMIKERHPNFNFNSIEKLQEIKLDSERVGIPAGKGWIVIGYILALMGGIIGIAIGWFIQTGKTKAIDGEKYYTYDDPSRKHGFRIKAIGIFALALFFLDRYFLFIIF